MSIVQHRSLKSIIKGIWTHSLSILTMFTFPYQVTVACHRMRGVKIGKKSHVARGVILDDRNPELIEIGKGVAVTSGVMILCHQRDLKNYRPGMYAMHCPFKEGRVVIKDGDTTIGAPTKAEQKGIEELYSILGAHHLLDENLTPSILE